MIQIRNVPDEPHRTLQVWAARAGRILSDYLLSGIKQVAKKPRLSTLIERLARDAPVALVELPDITIRRMPVANDLRNLG